MEFPSQGGQSDAHFLSETSKRTRIGRLFRLISGRVGAGQLELVAQATRFSWTSASDQPTGIEGVRASSDQLKQTA